MSDLLTYEEYYRINEGILVHLEKGGKGSGYAGHEGRPGQIGGSLPETIDGHSIDNIAIRNRHTYDGPGQYMGRGTLFGNKWGTKKYPGVEHIVPTSEEAINKYAIWLREQYKSKGPVYNALMNLVGGFMNGKKINLICSCAPKPCHCDIVKSAIVGIAKKIITRK